MCCFIFIRISIDLPLGAYDNYHCTYKSIPLIVSVKNNLFTAYSIYKVCKISTTIIKPELVLFGMIIEIAVIIMAL